MEDGSGLGQSNVRQSVTGIWIGLRKLNSNWSFGISLENEMKNEDENFK